MCKLINKKTNVEAELVRKENGKFVLLVDGKEKAYSESTIKRWWKQVEVEEPVEEVKEVVEPEKMDKEAVKELVNEPYTVAVKKPNTIESVFNNVKMDQPGGKIALYILELANDMGCTFKETSSYIGIKYNKKTIIEVHISKKGKIKLVVNSKSLPSGLKANLEKLTTCKLAPASYGWTLDYTIDCTNLAGVEFTQAVTEVIKWGVTFRM